MQHGSHLDPPNRFLPITSVPDWEHLAADDETLQGQEQREVRYFSDASESIVVENDSPDIPFRFSVNPYRGCLHACPYCYARNTHEYIGFNAGRDFETKIIVKENAPELFRKFLSRKKWICEPIVFSGVTDCYQPIERHFRLTRQCLEIARKFQQPIGIITKNALVLRDLDLLREMARRNLVHVNLSITTLDPELARVMEPRTSIPAARLRAIRALVDEGIPVRVMVAPLIPGLNDHEAPAILQAARQAGASSAGYILLRLPLTVEPVFHEWLQRTQTLKAEKIEKLIRDTRRGQMNSSQFGERMRGSGVLAEQIQAMFHLFRTKLGFSEHPPLDTSLFEKPEGNEKQLKLF